MEESNKQGNVSISVIGDAFVDLFCFLDGSLPEEGGDARLKQPIRAVAGGSALNTSTHLSFLLNHLGYDSSVPRSVEKINSWNGTKVALQTVLNDTDAYGKILLQHMCKHNIVLRNLNIQTEDETGHCVVMVSNNERSFMTYLGCVGKFTASAIDVQQLIKDHTVPSIQHHQHIHVAGYYNISGFWDGRLKHQLSFARQKRADYSLQHPTYRNYSTTISLVPQHDATGQWDGQLIDLLGLIDFLILSALEAVRISKVTNKEEYLLDGDKAGDTVDYSWQDMASFFHSVSPNTYIVVTLGKRGAVVLFQGSLMLECKPPISHDNPIDPTGAGDAFAAGFLYGLTNCWKTKHTPDEFTHKICQKQNSADWNRSIYEGLKWGCVTGSCCVMTEGASCPPSKDDITKMHELLK